MNNICIIPARGGSKRIPKKNIRNFFGKPIIAYSIRAAKESGLFQRIIVSTDSEEIAEIAKKYGAEVPFIRPAQCSSDVATTADVLVHALEWYLGQNISWDFMCCLYPTAPFCIAEVLKQGFDMLVDSRAPAVLPVTEFSYPILRSLKLNQSGNVEMNWPEYELTRSQDLPKAYHDAGQFYWLKVNEFIENPRLMPTGTKPLVLPRMQVVDIDTREDWDVAELRYKELYP